MNKREVKEIAKGIARSDAMAKAGAGLFSRWMDSIARRRPNGLVARFRRRFGKVPAEDIEEAAKKAREHL